MYIKHVYSFSVIVASIAATYYIVMLANSFVSIAGAALIFVGCLALSALLLHLLFWIPKLIEKCIYSICKSNSKDESYSYVDASIGKRIFLVTKFLLAPLAGFVLSLITIAILNAKGIIPTEVTNKVVISTTIIAAFTVSLCLVLICVSMCFKSLWNTFLSIFLSKPLEPEKNNYQPTITQQEQTLEANTEDKDEYPKGQDTFDDNKSKDEDGYPKGQNPPKTGTHVNQLTKIGQNTFETGIYPVLQPETQIGNN